MPGGRPQPPGEDVQGQETCPNKSNPTTDRALPTFSHTDSSKKNQDQTSKSRKPLSVKQILLKMAQMKKDGLAQEIGNKKDENLFKSDPSEKLGLSQRSFADSRSDDRGQKIQGIKFGRGGQDHGVKTLIENENDPGLQ